MSWASPVWLMYCNVNLIMWQPAMAQPGHTREITVFTKLEWSFLVNGWLRLFPCTGGAPGSCLRGTSSLVLQSVLWGSNDNQLKINGSHWLIAAVLFIFYVNYIVLFYLTFKISHFTLSLYLQYQTMIVPKNFTKKNFTDGFIIYK